MTYRFPFGLEVVNRTPHVSHACKAFILGAYPSALHVRWIPLGPLLRVNAIPVENEPVPFWNGEEEGKLIEEWKKKVGFREEWGRVEPIGRLNGSSGRWVDENVLGPLGLARQSVWIADCLEDYRSSAGVEKRIDDTYVPFAKENGLPLAHLKRHPGEDEIVAEACKSRLAAIRRCMISARPQLLITLGNAALRVIRTMAGENGQIPEKLSLKSPYGKKIAFVIDGLSSIDLLPLAHPAAPPGYQALHDKWRKGIRRYV